MRTAKALLVLAGLLPTAWAGQVIKPGPDDALAPDEIVVRLKPGVELTGVLRSLNVQATGVASMTRLPVHVLRVPAGLREPLSTILANSPYVDYVEAHHIRSTTALPPSDPQYGASWWLSKIQAADAWSLSPGRFLTGATAGARVKIAVLDTGADCSHPDFVNPGGVSPNSLEGGQLSFTLSQNLVPTALGVPACSWQDDNGHGTHTAGIVGAATNNGLGVASLGYPAELVIYKVLQANGSGSDVAIADAIMAAADAGARVISMSLGGAGYSQVLQDAVYYAWSRDALVVAAAGNANSAGLFFPAHANFAISVGATDSSDLRASFSNFGSSLDVMAPGVAIQSTYRGGGYAGMSGTSMATPFVAALAGLMAAASPGLAADSLAVRLERSADSTTAQGGWDMYRGFGRINAWRAISGTFRVASVGGLSGQVVGTGGLPVQGAVLSMDGLSVTTGSTGLFRFVNMTSGVYALTVAPPGGSPFSMDVVVPPGADSTVRIRTGQTAGVVSGYVTASGQAVAGATVQALEGGLVAASGVTNESGFYTFPTAAGSYSLRATAFGRTASTVNSISVAAATVLNRSFELTAPGAVEGTVKSLASAALAGVQVTATNAAYSAGAVTDATGAYRIEGLPAGTYSVSASLAQYETSTVTGVGVSDGTTATQNFQLGQVGTLTSIVLSPTTMGGGFTSAGNYVTIASPAGTGGAVVQLTSSAAGQAQPPATVTIAAGQTKSANFAITTAAVTASKTVSISATFGGVTKTATATLVPYSVYSLALTSSTMGGGAVTTSNRVTLNTAAPAAGMVVSLTSSSPVAVVPATITVPSGATNFNFTVTTSRVTASTPVVITATLLGVSKAVNLTVNPTALATLYLSPSSLAGGNTITAGYVALDSPAPPGGAVVTLTSSSPLVTVPAAVTIAEGAVRSANFTLPTAGVAAQTAVIVSAVYGVVTKSVTVTLRPPALYSLMVSPTTIAGGKAITGAKVQLDGPAPEGGLAVALSSSDPVAALPASVTVPQGSSVSPVFTVTTAQVTANRTAVLSAVLNGVTKSVTLTVKPPSLYALSFSTAPIAGGKTLTGATVSLDGPAPTGGATVTLTSTDPDAVPPASVLIPAGSAVSAAFSITTRTVTAAKLIPITASFAGTSKTVNLSIKPLAVTGFSVGSSLAGGKPATAAVSLDGPAPAGGAVVTLVSSNAVLTLPVSVPIAAGATTSAVFSFTPSIVNAATVVQLTASYSGSTKSVNVTVRPAVLYSLSIPAAPVPGGKAQNATVYLDGPAPAAGATIAITSSSPSAIPPAAAVVPSGASSVTFPIPTAFVTSTGTAVITAAYAGVSKTANLNVKPTAVTGFSISSTAVPGGKAITGAYVSLDGPAPPTGAVVTFSSSSAAAIPPAQVTVPAGATSSAAFAVATDAVTTAAVVTLTASYQGSTKTATVNVKPATVTGLALSSTSIKGGLTLGSVTLTVDAPAPAAGFVVSLASSSPAAQPPATVTVAPGATTAVFAIPTTTVAASTTATISATLNGVVKSANLTVNP